MALADIHAWVKVTDKDGHMVADGEDWQSICPVAFKVTYYAANEGASSAKFYVVGALIKNGKKMPNPVPAQKIELAENMLWKQSYILNWEPSDGHCSFRARIIGDVGNFVNEEDEENNAFTTSFTVMDPVK